MGGWVGLSTISRNRQDAWEKLADLVGQANWMAGKRRQAAVNWCQMSACWCSLLGLRHFPIHSMAFSSMHRRSKPILVENCKLCTGHAVTTWRVTSMAVSSTVL